MEGTRDSWIFIFMALFLCLFFKNSNEMAERFKPGWKAFIVLTTGAYAMLHMAEVQEFVYRFF